MYRSYQINGVLQHGVGVYRIVAGELTKRKDLVGKNIRQVKARIEPVSRTVVLVVKCGWNILG